MKTTIIVLQSLDGIISKGPDDDLSWGSKEDKKFFGEKVRECDIKIMGSKTFDSMIQFPKLLGEYSKTLVLTSDPNKYKDYENVYGGVYFFSGTPGEALDKCSEILNDLPAEAHVKAGNVAIVGGAYVYSKFLQANLVDEIYVSIAPKIFGDGIRAYGIEKLDIDLELLDVHKITDDEVLLHYRVKK